MRHLSRRDFATVVGVGLLASACGHPRDQAPTTAEDHGRHPGPKGSPARPQTKDVAVAAPEDLTQPLLSSDLLVFSKDTLSASTIEKIKAIKGKDGKKAILAVEPMAMAQFYVDEQPVTYAAVDPKTFWRFTVPGTAHTAAVWERVAGGEIAVQPRSAGSSRPRTAISSSATAPTPRALTSVPWPSCSTRAGPGRSTRW